jgi:hypothetical protein
VTKLGKMLPFGQTFLALGDFFQGKKPNDLGEILVELVWGLFGPFL